MCNLFPATKYVTKDGDFEVETRLKIKFILWQWTFYLLFIEEPNKVILSNLVDHKLYLKFDILITTKVKGSESETLSSWNY